MSWWFLSQLAERLDCSEAYAKSLLKLYHQSYPEVRKACEQWQLEADQRLVEDLTLRNNNYIKQQLNKLNKQMTKVILERFSVAGVQYGDYQRLGAKLKAGVACRFIGEPWNNHDRKAIRIEVLGVKIGYVPKGSEQQRALWEAHDVSNKVTGVVTAFNTANPSWQSITIEATVHKRGYTTKKDGGVYFDKVRN